MRAAKLALRRMVAAFGLDQARFDVDLALASGGDLAVQLSYDRGAEHDPFRQERELRAFGPFRWYPDMAKAAVGEMVWNVALSDRPPEREWPDRVVDPSRRRQRRGVRRHPAA